MEPTVTFSYGEVDLLVKELTHVRKQLTDLRSNDPENPVIFRLALLEGSLSPLIALLDGRRTMALIP